MSLYFKTSVNKYTYNLTILHSTYILSGCTYISPSIIPCRSSVIPPSPFAFLPYSFQPPPSYFFLLLNHRLSQLLTSTQSLHSSPLILLPVLHPHFLLPSTISLAFFTPQSLSPPTIPCYIHTTTPFTPHVLSHLNRSFLLSSSLSFSLLIYYLLQPPHIHLTTPFILHSLCHRTASTSLPHPFH